MASLLRSYLTYPPEGLFEPSTDQYSTIHMRIYLTYPQLNTSQLAEKANWPFNWLILDSWPQKNTWYFNWLILGNQPQKRFDLSTEQYQAIDHKNYLSFQLNKNQAIDHRNYLTFQLNNTRQSARDTEIRQLW